MQEKNKTGNKHTHKHEDQAENKPTVRCDAQ